MQTTQRLIQAYRQTPWRVQIQWIVGVLIALIGVMLVMGLYLNIGAQTVQAGVMIQRMGFKRDELQLSIASKNAKLAETYSSEAVRERSGEMGFEPANLDSALYVVVPEYPGREMRALRVNASQTPQLEMPMIKPAYTQSLWEWSLDQLSEWSVKVEKQP